ncbi:MAG: lamin tail domain-containing protein, partial [Planctomycetales bacterium]|nr:lamin tail domain-containing protein [Planctomycetales bacterium]
DTAVRYTAGVRFRGSGSRTDTIPNNRINIPADNPWQGRSSLNINENNPDNQLTGSAMFRLAGLPVVDNKAVRLLGNGIDRKNGGVYADAEVTDSGFAENHFPTDPNGNLYRGYRPNESPPGGQGAGLVYNGENPLPYVSYDKKTNASEADWSDVIELTRALNQTSDADFPDAVRQVIDVEQWFRAFAMNQLLDNQENGLYTGDTAGDDYAMYRGLIDTRFKMVPYDQDSLFNSVTRNIFEPNNVPALNRMISHPEFRPIYFAQFLDLIDNVLLTDAADEALDNALRGAATPSRIQDIKTFIANRAAYVKSIINAELTVTSGLGTQGEVAVATSQDISVFGTYPQADTRAIRVNGELATLNVLQDTWAYPGVNSGIQLVPLSSVWKYLDDGSDLGTAWRAANYNDTSWSSGRAQLGYGDDDETTEVGYGPNGSNKYVTTYFRSSFNVTDKSQFTSLNLRLLYDDGVAVYLNGTEVVRSNLAANATNGTLANTIRDRTNENSIESFSIPVSALVNGTNVFAVEIHQNAVDSPDIGFDLELTATEAGSGQIALLPGLNRLAIEAYGDTAGEGEVLHATTYDIYYNDGSETIVSGTVTGNNVWTAAQGPYRVQGSASIAAGASVTIEPGTTVYFDNNAKLTVNGKLQALGTDEAPVWFTRRPGTTSWNGLQFVNTMEDNKLDHVILEYGITDDGLVGLTNANLTVTNSLFDHTDRRRIRSEDSSLIVRNSTFATLFAPGQAPSTDNRSEHIWGGGIPAGGHWIIDGNSFGTLTGHNDAIDFDAPRNTGQYAQILNNVFLGGGDDALDMTGDIYIEGNVFHNFIKDEFNVDPGNSNTISSSTGTFWVVRNVFDNIQHAELIKETAYTYFLNNTVVNSQFEPLYFDLPGQTSGPGRGVIVQGSIFPDGQPVFGQVLPTTEIFVADSYLPAEAEGLIIGTGNRFGDAHVGGAEIDFNLLPGSGAIGAGPNGSDMGALIPAGVTVSGVPHPITSANAATLILGGPGYTEYRYSVDGGALSAARSMDQPIQLTNLANGTHVVNIQGLNHVGEWIDSPAVTWTIDPNNAPTVLINEVLADNASAYAVDGAFVDVIELYNYGTSTVDLSGYGVGDSASNLRPFAFPAGTTLGAGEYLLLTADASLAGPGFHLNFGLNRQGDGVFLSTPGGSVVDSVEFGHQLTDYSIGRVGQDLHWALNSPTLGQANVAAPVGDMHDVKINEWYADGSIRLESDFIELYNAGAYPADLGGASISDEPYPIPQMSVFAPLSFIPGKGFLVLTADGRPDDGQNHLPFQLNATHEHLGLFDADGAFIDQMFYYPQTSEFSQGRVPDGSADLAFTNLPTPGGTNGGTTTGDFETIFSFDWNTNWKYNASGQDLGTAWRTNAYDDAGWLFGPGLLGQEGGALPQPLRTSFNIGDITYYFRKTIQLDALPQDLTTIFSTIVDDGFIVYVNGTEIQRTGIDPGTVNSSTTANRTVGQASVEGPYSVPNSAWKVGENVIAVEVHQRDTGSSDVVFGMQLTATAPLTQVDDNMPEKLLRNLRITELFYHPSPATAAPEFIELQNVGTEPLNLSGVRLGGGIDFTFPTDTSLAAGEYIVVTEDTAAFAATFGGAARVAGQYAGKLSNGGEQIALQFAAPIDTAILRFAYDAAWYPSTDGGGAALSIVDGNADYRQWQAATSWMASTPTPGRAPGDVATADFNADGLVNATDIDLLCVAIHSGSGDLSYDLSGDGLVNSGDANYLISGVLHTTPGDANLDGIFDSTDFVQVFVAGKYENGVAGSAGWAEGDWDCDGEFTTRDLVAAFQAGGYVAAATPAAVDATFVNRPADSIDSQHALAAAALDGVFGTDDDSDWLEN